MSFTTIASEYRPYLVDAALVLIFLIFIFVGGKRGLYKSAAPVLVVVLSITAAIMVSAYFTPAVTDIAYEKYGGQLSQRLDRFTDKVEENMNLPGEVDLNGVIPQDKINSAEYKLAEKIVHVVLFVATLIAAILVFTLISKLIGPLADLPVVKQVDALGGAVFGFLQCFILLFLASKVCALLGVSFFEDMAEGTYLLAMFLAL